MKKYSLITFTDEGLNGLALAISLNLVPNVKDTDNFLFFRETYAGKDIYVEESFFSNIVENVGEFLNQNQSASAPHKLKFVSLLRMLNSGHNMMANFVELPDSLKSSLTPYFFKFVN